MPGEILCTHTGSLPRPDDLIAMMWAVGDGIPVDRVALEARIETAVTEIVAKQVSAGVSVINDGEMSKPSYATYVKDRLNGFGGESAPPPYPDWLAWNVHPVKVCDPEGPAATPPPRAAAVSAVGAWAAGGGTTAPAIRCTSRRVWLTNCPSVSCAVFGTNWVWPGRR